ncbi:hypothetical protein [Terasakiella sp. SH-1]|uniref:hypothetical protein n=1 Tax=Terasakiella sp. SH-1 TaxID=2560057 RepID=UPI00107382E8|nr:hypothetical protein [Terasakiella sp. SH-1]
MNKRDLAILSLIGLCALYMGVQLASSLKVENRDLYIRELSHVEEFENKLMTQKNVGTDIYLMARQWEWSSELTLQAGQTYRLHLATADIQHAFHLSKEATGQSIDILLQPGKEYIVALRNLREGVYAIGCTQYCGIEHNKMRGKLIVRK